MRYKKESTEMKWLSLSSIIFKMFFVILNLGATTLSAESRVGEYSPTRTGFEGYSLAGPAMNQSNLQQRENDLMQRSSGSGLADSLASGMYERNTSQIEYTQQQQRENDRQNAAATAGSSSGTGEAIHGAVGGLMTATAIPMLLSIEPITRAAGAALLAKGILEFAQSGADAGVKDQNNAQRDLIAQQKAPEERASDRTNPAQLPMEAQNYLSDRGVNPDDFMRRVQNGEFQSTDDILKGMGDHTHYTEAQLTAANQLATEKSGQIFSEAHSPNVIREKIGYDETNSTGRHSAEGILSGRASGTGAEKSAAQTEIKTSSEGAPELVKKSPVNPVLEGGGAQEKGGAMSSASTTDLLNSLLGASPNSTPSPAAMDLMNQLGISPLKKKQNIFEVANRNFRGWGKWRESILHFFVSSR